MQYYPFDSRNTLYKSEYGAIASNSNLRLSVLLHNDAKASKVFLCIRKDDSNVLCEYEMSEDYNIEDYIVYKKELTFDSGIYWYYFRYESDYGPFYISKTEHSLGIVSKEINSWQLTVYKEDFKTPDWLKGGIIYQIFPDRFYKSGNNQCAYTDRHIVENWYDAPQFENSTIGKDYFGGNLRGITEKLPYLASLSVSAIYLNPIFEAHSNHRYNTANYLKIDPMLGDENDLITLCEKAKEYGIAIILDGVFSHTGDDSIYFNKNGRYENNGAYNRKDSPYFDWYTFRNYPHNYESWWGIETLPETKENSASFTNFITGENGVIRYWLKKGISGWRLDVADELPDEFLDNLRNCAKEENKDAFILGEVWEDATNKISHGGRRRFLLGDQLDSVMNYPFYDAIVSFLNGESSRKLIDNVLDITENYPPQSISLLMNHIGTHDTKRILTLLGSKTDVGKDRYLQAKETLSKDEYLHGIKFLKLAAILQYTLPGVPSLYYGDEVGIEGYGDPFCRKTYPWGKENQELLDFYKFIGKVRTENTCFIDGKFIPVYANMGHIVYIRESLDKKNSVLIAVNRWCDAAFTDIPDDFENSEVIFGNAPQKNLLKIDAESFCILKKKTQV